MHFIKSATFYIESATFYIKSASIYIKSASIYKITPTIILPQRKIKRLSIEEKSFT